MTKNQKKICISFVTILFLIVFIIIIPLIINWLYHKEAPFEFFYVDYDISSILGYYGSILTFIGTSVLGGITIYQNHLSQKKTDDINRLTIELQKKSMAMAELSYKETKSEEIRKNTPKFELVNDGCYGRYKHLYGNLKNISNITASRIKSISFEIFDSENKLIMTSDKVKIKDFSISSGQETKVEFYNDEINFNKITIKWSFQCEGPDGNTYYYRANLFKENIHEFKVEPWEVKNIG